MSNSLKLVIAVRHGQDSCGELSLEGRRQIESLNENLKRIIPSEYKVAVLSSTYTRAKQSAEIISTAFRVVYQECRVLMGDEYGDGEAMMHAIKDSCNGADVMIAVTHHTAPSGIVNAFSKERSQTRVGGFVCPKGDGIMIDLVTGQVTIGLQVS